MKSKSDVDTYRNNSLVFKIVTTLDRGQLSRFHSKKNLNDGTDPTKIIKYSITKYTENTKVDVICFQDSKHKFTNKISIDEFTVISSKKKNFTKSQNLSSKFHNLSIKRGNNYYWKNMF